MAYTMRLLEVTGGCGQVLKTIGIAYDVLQLVGGRFLIFVVP